MTHQCPDWSLLWHEATLRQVAFTAKWSLSPTHAAFEITGELIQHNDNFYSTSRRNIVQLLNMSTILVQMFMDVILSDSVMKVHGSTEAYSSQRQKSHMHRRDDIQPLDSSNGSEKTAYNGI